MIFSSRSSCVFSSENFLLGPRIGPSSPFSVHLLPFFLNLLSLGYTTYSWLPHRRPDKLLPPLLFHIGGVAVDVPPFIFSPLSSKIGFIPRTESPFMSPSVLQETRFQKPHPRRFPGLRISDLFPSAIVDPFFLWQGSLFTFPHSGYSLSFFHYQIHDVSYVPYEVIHELCPIS